MISFYLCLKKFTMKNFNASLFAGFSIFTLLLFGSIAVHAQETPETNTKQVAAADDKKPAQRPNLVRLLNLTPEQAQQIRAINQETREKVREANQRQRRARRALDEAIYAETPSREEVDRLSREFGEAQTAVAKIRTDIEFRIRQVMTAEQIARFRQLRQRAVQTIRQRKNQ